MIEKSYYNVSIYGQGAQEKKQNQQKIVQKLKNHQCYGENKKVLWPKHKSMKSQITFNPPKNPKQAHLESYLIIVQLHPISYCDEK